LKREYLLFLQKIVNGGNSTEKFCAKP